MEEPRIGREQPFIAHDEAAEVPQPREGALDDPAMAVASECSPILVRGVGMGAARGNDRLDPAAGQAGAQRIRVVGAIGNEARGSRARPTGPVRARYVDCSS